MSGVIVTIADARVLGYCARGLRVFCQQHKFDYLDFIRKGISEDVLKVLNDDMANRVIDQAYRRLNERDK